MDKKDLRIVFMGTPDLPLLHCSALLKEDITWWE